VAADNEAARYLSLLEGRVSRQGSGRCRASKCRLRALYRRGPMLARLDSLRVSRTVAAGVRGLRYLRPLGPRRDERVHDGQHEERQNGG
jgi:hypothetical protein